MSILAFFILYFYDHDPENPSNNVQKSVPQEWSGKLSGKWSGKRSPDFEGEFIEMFPMDRLYIFDGIWAVPRHFFFDVSEKMFDRLLLRNFSC